MAQAVRIDPTPVFTIATNTPPGAYSPVLAIPGATVSINTTTYTDATGSVSCPTNAQITIPGTSACVSTATQQGSFGFWVLPATSPYFYTIVLPNSQVFGPFPVSAGGGGGGGGGGTVAPPVNSIQYNGGTAFAGSTNLTYTPGSQVVTIAGIGGTPGLILGGGSFVESTGGFLSQVPSGSWQAFNSQTDGALLRGYGVVQNVANTKGGYFDFAPVTYNPYDSGTPCLDFWGNVVNQPLPLNGLSGFGANDTIMWVSTSPSMPASGSCGAPLPVNTTYGLNINSYIFPRGGMATDLNRYNAINALTGGVTAGSVTAGVLYPAGTVTNCCGTLSVPTYLGGYMQMGISNGVPSAGTIATVNNPFTGGSGLEAGTFYWDSGLAAPRVYNGTTWGYFGGSGGTPAFSVITSGTNTSAAMSVGTGASLTSTGTGIFDVHAGGATSPAQTGTAAGIPATCAVGQTYFASDATAGKNLYFCTATNTWTQMVSSGGGAAFSAITGGTNNGGAAMVVGSTSSLTVSGSGTINANLINGAVLPASGSIVKTNGSLQAVASAYTDIVLLWASGSCVGYLKNDGTCSSSTGVTSITGTTNQVIASASTGAVTLSLPQSINTTAAVTFGTVTTGGSAGTFVSGATGTNFSFANNNGNFSANGNGAVSAVGVYSSTGASGGFNVTTATAYNAVQAALGGMQALSFTASNYVQTGNHSGVPTVTTSDAFHAGAMYWDTGVGCEEIYNGSTWACTTTGSSSAAGSNTNVQYNNGGAFAGSNNFTWNNSTGVLAVTGTYTASNTGTNITFQNSGGNFQVNAAGAVSAAGIFSSTGGSGGFNVTGNTSANSIQTVGGITAGSSSLSIVSAGTFANNNASATLSAANSGSGYAGAFAGSSTSAAALAATNSSTGGALAVLSANTAGGAITSIVTTSTGFDFYGVSTAGSQFSKITNQGHYVSTGSSPTIGVGGFSVISGSTDTRGGISHTSSSGTVTMTFNVPYATTPWCVASDENQSTAAPGLVGIYSISTTAVSFTVNTVGTMYYHCMQ